MVAGGAQGPGRIGRDWRDSEPWWPEEPTPPEGAPNVVLVVLDDVGFAQLGCYGSDIDTPAIDALAAGRRAPGQLPHHGAVLAHPGLPADRPQPPPKRDGPGGRPGQRLPGLLGGAPEGERVPLRGAAGPGLRHLRRGEVAPLPAGPDPHGCDPAVVAARSGVRPVVRVPRRGDPAVRPRPLPRQPRRPADPLLGRRLPPERRPGGPGHRVRGRPAGGRRRQAVLLVPGHGGLPLPAPGPGRVDRRATGDGSTAGGTSGASAAHARQLATGVLPPGTRLSPRPVWVPAWDDLDERSRTVAARFMECFAAFLSYTDHQLGRVIEFLADLGELDDTLVVLVSDNGASAEGGRTDRSTTSGSRTSTRPAPRSCTPGWTRSEGPAAHNNYPWGWTMAGNTPFKRWKREVHQGGVADPCIVHWPRRLRRGRRRGAPPVHPRHRRHAHRAGAGRGRATRGDRPRAPVAPRRRELRLPARAPTGPRPPSATRPSTSRC